MGLNPLLDPPLHASLSPAPLEEKFHHGLYLDIEGEGGLGMRLIEELYFTFRTSC